MSLWSRNIKITSMKSRLVIYFSALCSCCMAKDVIVTKDAQQIEAKVTEVSETEVKYKKASNPNGPTFVMSTDKIATVVYENGEIQTFQPTVVPVHEIQPQTNAASGEVEEKTEQVKKASSHPKILYSRITLPDGRRRKRYHSEDNSLIMRGSEFSSYLAAHCPEAHRQLRKSNGTAVASIFLDFFFLPAGLALAIVSSVQSEKVLPIYNEKCAEE